MKQMEWGFLIINYLFLGGLSAGVFFVSALATFLRRNSDSTYVRVARWGAFLAPWPLMFGSALLIFDLGKCLRFYKLFLHFRWTSPMSIGSWLLLTFNLLSLLYCYAWLTSGQRQWLFSKLPNGLGLLNKLNIDIDHRRRQLAFLGAPFAVGVGIYTGVLLGAVQARPFWNTNLLAQMFLFSALSTGCAALILLLSSSARPLDLSEFRLLYGLDVAFMTLELFIVIPYLLHGELSVQAVQDSLQLILGGPFTVVFWLLFLGIGLLAPLALELRELAPVLVSRTMPHSARWMAAATAALVLGGGFVLRYTFVFAGQVSAFK